MKRSARMAAFLLAAALSAAPCLAEFTPVEVPQATNASAAPEATENVPQITEKGLTLGNNSVKYPEITGMADENIQQQVNDAILQAGENREPIEPYGSADVLACAADGNIFSGAGG